MESLGKYLKAARESRGLSLKDVFASTRIREHLLRAIEEDRYELLPTGYGKGFVNAYARCLGLNPNDIILWYQRYTEKPAPSTPLSTLRPSGRSLRLGLKLQRVQKNRWSRRIEAGLKRVFIPALKKKSWSGRRVDPRLIAIAIAAILFIGLLVYYATLKLMKPFETRPTGLHQKTQALHPTDPGATDPGLKVPVPFEVVDMGLGTGIERKDDFLALTGKASEFVCNVHKVHFLTRIRAKNEGKVFHVWLWQGKEFHRKELEIKAPEWSVYSFITLRPNHSGDWKVEVRDGDKVIAALDFKAAESNPHSTPKKHTSPANAGVR